MLNMNSNDDVKKISFSFTKNKRQITKWELAIDESEQKQIFTFTYSFYPNLNNLLKPTRWTKLKTSWATICKHKNFLVITQNHCLDNLMTWRPFYSNLHCNFFWYWEDFDIYIDKENLDKTLSTVQQLSSSTRIMKRFC